MPFPLGGSPLSGAVAVSDVGSGAAPLAATHGWLSTLANEPGSTWARSGVTTVSDVGAPSVAFGASRSWVPFAPFPRSSPVIVVDPFGALAAGIVGARAQLRYRTDPVGATDASTRAIVGRRDLVNPLGLVDITSRMSATSRAAIDTLGLTDLALGGVIQMVNLTDAVGIADPLALVEVIHVVAPVDPVSAQDLTAWSAVMQRSPFDGLGLLDILSRTTSTARSRTDALGFADSASRRITGRRNLTNPVTIHDVPAFAWGRVRTVVDAAGLLDLATRSSSATRALVNALGGSDALAAMVINIRSALVELLAASDQASAVVFFVPPAPARARGSIVARAGGAVGIIERPTVVGVLVADPDAVGSLRRLANAAGGSEERPSADGTIGEG